MNLSYQKKLSDSPIGGLMKQKIMLLVLVALLLSFSIGNAETVTLKEVLKPWTMSVDDEQLYVAEKFSIYIYSLKDFKLRKHFGQRGRGPADFPIILHVHAGKSKLVISSLYNVHFFSKAGEYKGEIKSTAFSGRFLPLGTKFVGLDRKEEKGVGYYTINLFDSSLKKGPEIYRYERSIQAKGKVNPLAGDVVFQVFKEMILVAGKDDDIHVFDKNGSKRGKITPRIKKIKLTGDFKKRYINQMKADKRQRMIYEMFKDRIKMPSFYPLIRFFMVDEKQIYVVTHEEKDGLYKCVTLDLEGKITGQYWLPLTFADLKTAFPFKIRNNTLYQLLDDPEEETWKLKVWKFKR